MTEFILFMDPKFSLCSGDKFTAVDSELIEHLVYADGDGSDYR
jgi:hypothetical protein